jgi:hypothetical protein
MPPLWGITQPDTRYFARNISPREPGGGTLYHGGGVLIEEGREPMHALASQAQSAFVTDERGAEIQRRLAELGITDREFYAKTGIDRKTLRRAVAGEEGTRASTYMAINAALDKIEAVVRGVEMDPSADFVEFTVEGNFGVRAVVKGPVKDMEELQKAVSRLVREMRSNDTDDA